MTEVSRVVRTSRLLALLLCVYGLLAAGAPSTAHADDAKRARAHAKQAKAYFEAGDYSRAAQEYEAAYELDRKPTRLYNIAVCHERQGDPRQALAFYRAYLEADPDGEAAKLAANAVVAIQKTIDQEEALERQRESEASEARKRAEAASAQKRAQAEAQAREHALRADSLSSAGAHADAATELLAAYQQDPTTTSYLWRAAEAYRLAGDTARAHEQYRNYLAAAPDGAHADAARRALEHSPTPVPAFAAPPPLALDESEAAPATPGWLWPALAGVALASGIALDTLPASARNGRYDALDFVPLGCYALSATFVAVWKF